MLVLVVRFFSPQRESVTRGPVTVKGNGRGVDIAPLVNAGVPGFLLRLEDEWWNSRYFWYTLVLLHTVFCAVIFSCDSSVFCRRHGRVRVVYLCGTMRAC